ncbi:MAG: hypothetical protein JWR59_1734, partial [Brevundimonas sp.]|nr:hypothetical protein [Brevundimonas sp.]
VVLSSLTVIGTVAMLGVGGGILLHGSHTLGLVWPAEPVEQLSHTIAEALGAIGPLAGWLTAAVLSSAVGVVVGGGLALGLHQVARLRSPGH